MNDYPPSGALFANQRKQKPTQPDFTGDLELSDEVVSDLVSQMERGNKKPKLRLAGWKKQSKKGTKFISILGSKFEERQPAQQRQTQSNDFDLNDDVPF
tara:strand:- start:446 stop:742 length:297 start_codon:yes stop_codon:yes gene_type:complete